MVNILYVIGFGGSPRILDIGGVPYLMPIPDKSKVNNMYLIVMCVCMCVCVLYMFELFYKLNQGWTINIS